MPDMKTALIILGIILGCCACMVIGGYFGKKLEVFRVVMFSGILALIAIVVFVVYSAVFLLSSK
jgi:hypothetical protein